MEAAHDTDVSRDDRAESLHRHCRELYGMRMERETPEEAEVKTNRRNRQAQTPEQLELRRATRRQYDG